MAGENIAAGISPMGFDPYGYNSYSNQVMLNDMTGMNSYPQMGFGMGMDDSIFGDGAMGMGMGMPFGPSFGGNNNQYYENMEKYQDYMVNSQVRQQQRMRAADITMNATQEGIKQKAILLNEKIVQSEQQQVIPAFKAYVESVRSFYGNQGTEEDLKNKALSLYQQQFGETIQESLRKNGRDSFTQGLMETGLLFIPDRTSAEENIAKITNQPVGRSEKMKKAGGNAAGGAILALLANFALSMRKAAGTATTGGGKTALVVGLVGALVGWAAGKTAETLS